MLTTAVIVLLLTAYSSAQNAAGTGSLGGSVSSGFLNSGSSGNSVENGFGGEGTGTQAFSAGGSGISLGSTATGDSEGFAGGMFPPGVPFPMVRPVVVAQPGFIPSVGVPCAVGRGQSHAHGINSVNMANGQVNGGGTGKSQTNQFGTAGQGGGNINAVGNGINVGQNAASNSAGNMPCIAPLGGAVIGPIGPVVRPVNPIRGPVNPIRGPVNPIRGPVNAEQASDLNAPDNTEVAVFEEPNPAAGIIQDTVEGTAVAAETAPAAAAEEAPAEAPVSSRR